MQFHSSYIEMCRNIREREREREKPFIIKIEYSYLVIFKESWTDIT